MTSTQMRAVVLTAHGSPLQIGLVPRPEAGEGLVLIRVKASAVNPLDLKISKGQATHARHPLPAILGIDVAGTVESVGRGVAAFTPGDEVYGMAGGVGGVQGSLAEFMAADARLLAQKPRNSGMREAAALPLIFITAWEGLVDRAHVRGGQRVLVHGGAGGVGHRCSACASVRCRSLCHRLTQGQGLYRAARRNLHRLQANRGRGLCRGAYRGPRF
jgi:NADPH2:quinone reductase